MHNYQASRFSNSYLEFPSNELNVIDTTAYLERQDILYEQKIRNMREERQKLESEHHNLMQVFST